MKKLFMCLAIGSIAMIYSSSSVAMANKNNIVELQFWTTDPASSTEKLLKGGADVNEQDAKGNTALYYVIERNPENTNEKIRILMKYGANPKLKNKQGEYVYDLIDRIGQHGMKQYGLQSAEDLIRDLEKANLQKKQFNKP